MRAGLVAIGLLLAARLDAATPVRLTADDPRCHEVVLRVTAEGGEAREIVASAVANIDQSPPFVIAVAAPADCWAAPLRITSESREPNMRIRLAAELRGVVKNRSRPASLSVALEDVTIDCPVEASGRWSCRVPRAKLDLRIAAAGHAPRYVWDADLTSGRLDLGALSLTEGASVAGWITSEQRGLDLRTATIRLVPDQYAVSDQTESLRSYAATASQRGFFQFANVFPGTYAVVVEAESVSPGRRGGLVIQEGRELVLDEPVALYELTRLEILISPPLAPDGQSWRVRLARALPYSGMTVPLQDERAGEGGTWQSAPLQANRHTLEILDAKGATFEFEHIEVEPHMAPLNVVLSTVAVKGKLRIGGTAIRAGLRFVSGRGEQIELQSDEDGAFEGVLPREGKWDVTISIASPKQERLVEDVSVRRRDGHEHARVDIDLSGVRIRGKVVDEDGKAVRGAVNLVRGLTPENGTVTGDDGEFEMLGVAPGTITMFAFAKGRESEAIDLVVEKDRNPDPMTLVVVPQREVSFTLSTTSGFPVAGAHVRYALRGALRSEYSSPSGRFRLRIPRSTSRLQLAITAPGLPSKLVAVDVTQDRGTIALSMSDAGGVLRLRSNGAPPWPWVFHDGALFSLPALLAHSPGSGPPNWLRNDGIVIDVEPGTYALCPEAHPSDRCIRGSIATGGVELFDVRPWWPKRDAVTEEESK